ncbi:hypothetical protein R3P38DRAFT_3227803 [Favolaschia claudopus]|uniref:Uncharacterized protein n=1 Tax=Favolaschia claudopus TaxID=2862362 RepID=A0AAV9ZQZ1_9AGAR
MSILPCARRRFSVLPYLLHNPRAPRTQHAPAPAQVLELLGAREIVTHTRPKRPLKTSCTPGRYPLAHLYRLLTFAPPHPPHRTRACGRIICVEEEEEAASADGHEAAPMMSSASREKETCGRESRRATLAGSTCLRTWQLHPLPHDTRYLAENTFDLRLHFRRLIAVLVALYSPLPPPSASSSSWHCTSAGPNPGPRKRPRHLGSPQYPASGSGCARARRAAEGAFASTLLPNLTTHSFLKYPLVDGGGGPATGACDDVAPDSKQDIL